MEREGEREELSRGKHTRLLAGRREEQTCKQTFMNNFTQKSKLLPGAACKLLEGGVRRKSCAQSDMNLKTIPVIDNVNKKGDAAVCNIMILEER